MGRREARELREKTEGELEDDLNRLQRQCLEIRIKAPTDEGVNPYKLREYRRRIARIRTILNERVRAAGREA